MINWENYYRRQEKPGWCGPAVIQMTLLAGDINISQAEISDYVYKEWWGTPSELIIAYLSKYFKIVDFKTDSLFYDVSYRDISYLLNKKYVLIVGWWDDIDEDDYNNGHYSIITEYNNKDKMITLADPSRGRGLWKMSYKKFREKWFDTLDTNNRIYIKGLMIWIDLNSKIIEDKI